MQRCIDGQPAEFEMNSEQRFDGGRSESEQISCGNEEAHQFENSRCSPNRRGQKMRRKRLAVMRPDWIRRSADQNARVGCKNQAGQRSRELSSPTHSDRERIHITSQAELIAEQSDKHAV